MLSSNLLRGEKVRLTAVTADDLPTLFRWWQDADFLRLYDAVPAYPQTEEQLRKRVETGQKGDNNFLWGIRPFSSDELVGLLELDGILWSQGTASLSIAIGDKANRGQGYGMEAMQLALGYAFHELNLRRVFLTVFSYNKSAIALYEKLGFIQEGVYREHIRRDGQSHDMLLYGMLYREWQARQERS